MTLLVGRHRGRKGIRPVQTEWWGAGVSGVVICLERGADLHMAQLMPLPLTVSCFSKMQIGFTFLVPADLGSPGKGPLNGCVCVCVCVNMKIVCLIIGRAPAAGLPDLFLRPLWMLQDVVPFLLPEQRCGMACQAMLRRPRRCRCSRTGSRHTCSASSI